MKFRSINNRTWLTQALAVTVAAIALVPGASAQERFGSFLGTVTDASGGAVSGASVTLTNKTTERELKGTSDSRGTFVFRNVEPGRYKFNFEKSGFSRAEVTDAAVTAGQEITVNSALQVATSSQTVTITDAAALIDVTGVAKSNTITAEEFENLPKGRSFQSIAAFSPSVNTGQLEAGYQINGASGAENQFFIDGVSTNSAIDGRSRQNGAFEFLQEVQVKTGGIDAEYSGALGGTISAITRTGGAKLRGEAHYYLQSNTFSAQPVQRLYMFDQFAAGKTPVYVQDKKQGNDTHEFGASLGGALIKDKLFFFTSASPQLQRRRNDYLFSNGTEADTMNSNQTNQQLFNKLTWNPTQKLRVNASWLWTPTRSEGILPAYNGGTSIAALTSKASAQSNKTQGWTQPQSNYTGQIDYTINPTSVLTVKGGRFWDNFRTWGVPSVSSVTFQTAPTGVTGLPADLAAAKPGFSNTPRTQATFLDITTRTYYQVDFSKYVSHFLGSHDIKIGQGVSKAVNRVDVSYPGSGFVYVYFNTCKVATSPCPAGQVNPALFRGNGGTYGYYEVDNIGTQGTTGGTINNLYIQDHWKIMPRLSITLGLRTENEHIPSFRRNIGDQAFQFGFADKMAPRVGAAWDVKGDGKLKVYGSYSRLIGNVPYETSRGSFGGDIWTIYYRSLDTLDVLSLSGTNKPGNNLWAAGAFRDRRVPNFNTVDPNIKPMSTDFYNGGVEYQFAAGTVFKANYVGNHLVRTIEDMGTLVNGDEVYQYVNPGEGIAVKFNSAGLTPTGFATPKPKRNYDAVELSVSRSFGRAFYGQASYVVSRLYGNYAGLANTDEITTPTSGVSSSTTQQSGGSIARPGSAASRAWDLDEILFDAKGNITEGRLATDRPNVFKVFGNYTQNWGKKSMGSTDLGVFFFAQNGTPVTTSVETVNQVQTYVNGRGDLGRTPFFTQTNLVVGHSFKVAEGKALRFEFNMINLFNKKTVSHIFNQPNRGANTSNAPDSGIDLSGTNLFKGYDYKALLAAIAKTGVDPYDARFGLPDLFSAGFSGRLGVKFTF